MGSRIQICDLNFEIKLLYLKVSFEAPCVKKTLFYEIDSKFPFLFNFETP